MAWKTAEKSINKGSDRIAFAKVTSSKPPIACATTQLVVSPIRSIKRFVKWFSIEFSAVIYEPQFEV